jgi:hypothetical protein
MLPVFLASSDCNGRRCLFTVQVCDGLGVRRSERADDIVTPPEQPNSMLDSRLLPLLRMPAMPNVNNVGESKIKNW